MTWARDAQSFYYTTVDDAWRSDKVWQHTLGTAQSDDILIFHEPDDRYWVGFGRSRDDRFLMIASGSKNTAEYRVLDAENPDAGFWLFAERVEDLDYSLEPAVIGGVTDVLGAAQRPRPGLRTLSSTDRAHSPRGVGDRDRARPRGAT